MFIRGLLFQLDKRVGLVLSRPHIHLIQKLTCSRHDIAEQSLSWR